MSENLKIYKTTEKETENVYEKSEEDISELIKQKTKDIETIINNKLKGKMFYDKRYGEVYKILGFGNAGKSCVMLSAIRFDVTFNFNSSQVENTKCGIALEFLEGLEELTEEKYKEIKDNVLSNLTKTFDAFNI